MSESGEPAEEHQSMRDGGAQLGQLRSLAVWKPQFENSWCELV